MSTRISIIQDTAAGFAAKNPILRGGEMGIETDTTLYKFGDGNTSWNSLAYQPNTLRFSAGSASAASITTVGDTDTGIYFPAANTVGITTGGAERLRVDSSGRLVIGSEGISEATGVVPALQVNGTTTSSARQIITRFSDDTAGGVLSFIKSRGTSVGTHGLVSSGDRLGAINFRGSNGSIYPTSVAIVASADAEWATAGDTSDAPGRLAFQTCADGSSTLTERMRIDSNGLITGTGTSLGAWTAYTPTLGGTGWAIGDGTATGAYCQIGKLVQFRVLITFGSTSTFGGSALTVSLPIQASGSNQPEHSMNTTLLDASLSVRYSGLALFSNTTTMSLRSSGSGALATLTTSAPFAWASGDKIAINGTYEAA